MTVSTRDVSSRFNALTDFLSSPAYIEYKRVIQMYNEAIKPINQMLKNIQDIKYSQIRELNSFMQVDIALMTKNAILINQVMAPLLEQIQRINDICRAYRELFAQLPVSTTYIPKYEAEYVPIKSQEVEEETSPRGPPLIIKKVVCYLLLFVIIVFFDVVIPRCIDNYASGNGIIFDLCKCTILFCLERLKEKE